MKLISSKIIFSNYRTITEKTFVDKKGRERTFEIIGSGKGSVTIFAMTRDNQVILLREFRPGPSKFFTDLPSGQVDEGETPLETAKRELYEETGYRSGKGKVLTSYFKSAYSSEEKFAVLLTECEATEESKKHPVELKDVEQYFAEFDPSTSINPAVVYIVQKELNKT